MKNIIITVLAVIAITQLHAVEYVTLSESSPSKSISSNSLVKIVGYNTTTSTNIGNLAFTLANGDTFSVALYGAYNAGSQQSATSLKSVVGDLYTGVTNIVFNSNTGTKAVTLKITPASEINTVGPKTFLVLPENQEGNYDVIIESSNDLTTWTPFISQTVASESSPAFFRARIIKTPAP